MLTQAIVSFLRGGKRYVLVNKDGGLVKVDSHVIKVSFADSLRGNIVFLNNDLPDIPHYSHNHILQRDFLVFALKITDFYRQKNEKQALVLLIKDNY